jgi:hypothetical protein
MNNRPHHVFQMYILLKLFLIGEGGTAMLNEGRMEEIREDLETVSAAWERAMVSNDAVAIGQFMAEDWVIVSATGITKKGDFLAVVASGDLAPTSGRLTFL